MDWFLNRSGLITGVLAMLSEAWLIGAYSGSAYGAGNVCDYRFPNYTASGISFWVSDSDPFLFIQNQQLLFIWPMLLFLLVKVFERGLITRLLNAVLVLVAAISWFGVFQMINHEMTDPDKYLSIMRETSLYPKFILGFVITTAVLQLCSVIIWFRKPNGRLQ